MHRVLLCCLHTVKNSGNSNHHRLQADFKEISCSLFAETWLEVNCGCCTCVQHFINASIIMKKSSSILSCSFLK